MDLKETAREQLCEFKGDAYSFGIDCLDGAGPQAAKFGKRALIIANPSEWMKPTVDSVRAALAAADVDTLATTPGARPNSPLEDTYRMQDAIEKARPTVMAAIGGGSTIDAAKSANVLATLTPGAHDLEPFFGVDKVSEALDGRKLTPMVAVETAASSGAHLTKYSNITNLETGQKKLVNDPAIVPPAAVFDYSVTTSASRDLTIDGAFDGISHCLEVYCGAKGRILDKVEPIALAGIELCISGVAPATADANDLEAREMLGLGTDLGGYCIMTGSTNAGHLSSFSLVDVTTHGRATAVLNPYYLVLFANAVESQLEQLAALFRRTGHLKTDVSNLSGRDLSLAVAGAWKSLLESLGVPTAMSQFDDFTPAHIDRSVEAAKNPQLEMKLKAMPVPMDAAAVDKYMRGALEAAAEGDIEKAPTMPA